MKKLLLASTALVLSAGLANAQALTITGEGRMGIIGTDAGAGWAFDVENRLTLNFNVSVEGDHGLTFGAWMRARTSGNGGTLVRTPGGGTALVNSLSGSRVWVESNGLRLTFGNQDGAIRGAGTIGYAGGCGIGYVGGHLCADTAGLIGNSLGQNSTGAAGGNDRVNLGYTMGDIRLQLTHDRGLDITEVGATGSFDAFTVAAGYTTQNDVWTISGRYNGGSWNVGALVAGNTVATNWQLNGSVALGGGNLYAFYGDVFGASAYGVSYGYGLGGGATLTGGWETLGNVDTVSVGVAFNF